MIDSLDIEEEMRKKKEEEIKKKQEEMEEEEKKSPNEGDIEELENKLREEVKSPHKQLEERESPNAKLKKVPSENKSKQKKETSFIFEANPEFYLRRLEDRYRTVIGEKVGESMIEEIQKIAKQLNIIK